MTRRRLLHPAVLLLVQVSIAPLAIAQYDRYGVHEFATRIPVPVCDGSARVVCLVDSTRHYSDECCASVSSSQWLVLPVVGDSLEFFGISASTGIYLSLEQGERRLWEEHLPGLMAPFLRKRFSEAGVYTLTVDLDPLDSAIGLPYELRVRTVVGGGSRSVAPLLTIVAAKNARIQVGPRSAERTPETSWRDTVRPGTYRVYASGLDSLAVCRVPCRKPVFVRLAGASTLTIRP